MYSFSIVIPVLNEAPIINHTIEHLYRIRLGFDVEVIVVDGDPRGATLSAIHHKDVIKVLSLRGRGTQMNKGASVAKGEVVLFLLQRHLQHLLTKVKGVECNLEKSKELFMFQIGIRNEA